MPKSKPPRTNIDKELEEILLNSRRTLIKCNGKDGHEFIQKDPGTTVEEIKQTLLTYIKELVGEQEDLAQHMSLGIAANPDRPKARNQLRKEILEKARKELND